MSPWLKVANKYDKNSKTQKMFRQIAATIDNTIKMSNDDGLSPL